MIPKQKTKVIHAALLLATASVASFVLQSFVIFLPLFASQLGAGPLELGIIGGVSNGVYSFLPLVIGHFATSLRRRLLLIVLALAVLATISIAYSVAAAPITLIPLRVIEGIGWSMLIASIESSLLDVTKSYSSSLAKFNASWSAGAIAATIVGGIIVELYSFHAFFQTIAVGLSIAVVANFILTTIASRVEEDKLVDKMPSSVPILSKTISDPPKRALYFIPTSIAAMIPVIALTFLPPFAKSIGVSILLIGLFTFSYPISRFAAYFLATIPTIRRRILGKQRNTVLLASLAICSLSTIFLTIPDKSGIVYFVLFAAIGTSYALVFTVTQSALIADAPYEKRGEAAGLFETAIGTGGFVGPIIAGVVLLMSISTPFIVPFFAFAVFLLFYAVQNRLNR